MSEQPTLMLHLQKGGAVAMLKSLVACITKG